MGLTPENAGAQKFSSPYKQKSKGGAPYTQVDLFQDPYQFFKPKINKKSEQLDKKSTTKYLSQTVRTSTNSKSTQQLPFTPIQERPELILMKGLDYKERVEKKRQEKEQQEIQSCTFIPKITTKVRPKVHSG